MNSLKAENIPAVPGCFFISQFEMLGVKILVPLQFRTETTSDRIKLLAKILITSLSNKPKPIFFPESIPVLQPVVI